MAASGAASFDDVKVKTSDRAFAQQQGGFLLAEGGEGFGATTELAQAELDAAAAASIEHWTLTLGDGDARLGGFGDVRITSADLAGAALGYTVGNTVYIDSNAAGYGWSTSGAMDLVTVMTHEFGHLLGLEHDEHAYGVMQPTLSSGVQGLLDAAGIAVDADHLSDKDLWKLAAVAAAQELQGGAPFGLPGFDFDQGAGKGGGYGTIDWQSGAGDPWATGYSPIGGAKTKDGGGNFSEYLVKLGGSAGKGLAAGFDSLGSALLGKKGKSGR
jgi:hypothetical protein